MVTYRCPSNTAVQVYNYQHKTARVVFGPELVILDPHESFNVLFLSGRYREWMWQWWVWSDPGYREWVWQW